ncbi:MAG: FG-GAP-like repeat-containing protein [Gemmataceae bacterium]|nr:FG-GAP-like repeat-containing protein [Gemmataceae bacterium]
MSHTFRLYSKIAAFLKYWASRRTRRATTAVHRFIPQLQVFEDRVLPAAWVPTGPAPQLGSNTLGTNGQFGSPDQSYAGRISAIAISSNYDGQGHSAMYLGAASGGVWRSANYASASPDWAPLTDSVGLPFDTARPGTPGALNVGSIVVDPFNPRIIYVGTGEANTGTSAVGLGVLKSLDGGDTWSVVSTGPNNAFSGRSVSEIFVDPTHDGGRSAPGQTIYISVVPTDLNTPTLNDGVYKSINGGATWVKVSDGIKLKSDLQPVPTVVTDLDYTVNAGRLTIFAGVGDIEGDDRNGVWRGTLLNNGSLTWDRLPNVGLPDSDELRRISLASDHVSTVYAAMSLPTTLRGSNVYKTINNGTSWVATDPPGNFVGNQGNYNLAIGLSPGGRVYLGGQEPAIPSARGVFLLESNAGATAWNVINQGSNGVQPHADAHAIAFDSFGNVYLGTDGGLWRYDPLPFDVGPLADVGKPLDGSSAVGDFNRDGRLDMAVLTRESQVAIMFGRGDGTFTRGPLLTANQRAASLAVGDFDGDGQLDVVVANRDSKDVSLFLRNANGTFKDARNFAVGRQLGSIAAGDFNGDGRLDLAVMHVDDGGLSVLLGDAQQIFRRIGPFTISAGVNPTGELAVGDFNADGRLDIAATDVRGGNVSVLLGNANPNPAVPNTLFLPSVPFPTAAGARRLAAGDFNGDGRLDLVIGNIVFGRQQTLSVLLANPAPIANDPRTVFLAAQNVGVPGAFSVRVGDFDGDGKQDLAVQLGGDQVQIMFGNGDGTFGRIQEYAFPRDAFGRVNAGPISNAADFNGDGRPDLAMPHTGTEQVRLLLSNRHAPPGGTGAWLALNSPGLQTQQLYSIAVSPTTRKNMFVSTHDNGTARTVDGGRRWTTLQGRNANDVQAAAGGGDGFLVRYASDGNSVYVMNNAQSPAGPPVFRSDDGGTTWSFAGFGLSDVSLLAPLAIHPQDAKTVAIGTLKGDLFITTTGGSTGGRIGEGRWRRMPGPRGAMNINMTANAIGRVGNNFGVYAGYSNGGLYKRGTLDPQGMVPWIDIKGPWDPRGVNNIVVDPNNPDLIYVTLAGTATDPDSPPGSQLWRTTDGGRTWENLAFAGITRVFPNNSVFRLVIDPDFTAAAARVYVATDTSVFQGTRTAFGWTWQRVGDGLPNNVVRDLQLRKYDDGSKVLVAATFGRGAWTLALAGIGAPTISAVSVGGAAGPAQGPLAGGTQVTIAGANLVNDVIAVRFGDVPVTSFAAGPGGTLIAESPAAQARGAVPITVITAGGISTVAASGNNEFTYVSTGLPGITGLTALSGPTGGGTLVRISGSNFLGTQQVLFSGVPAKFVVNSNTQITAVAPVSTEGPSAVRVVNASGISPITQARLYTYLPAGAATVSKVVVGSGPVAGGTMVNIIGSNLSGAVKVFFGDTEASAFAVQSDVLITATAPPHAAGLVDVRIITRNTNGQDVSSLVTPDDVFRYIGAPQGRTSLSASDNPSVFGQPITFTATVLADNPADGTPTGTVTFADGVTTLDTVPLDQTGTAVLTTSALTAGSHPITATYSGDDTFTGSNDSLSQFVAPAATTAP